MAPKPLVPADFGLENLYDEFHGNVTLKLQNNAEMKGNSMILKMNSPVFGEIFSNLKIRTLEMEDFSEAAVIMFLESLYTGEVKPNTHLFRDINKMAHVFKVTWMVERCEEYFQGMIQNANDYESLLFVFEEARYLKKAVKKPGYLDAVMEMFCKMMDRGAMFVEKYMQNYLDLSTNQIELMIKIAGEDICIFMRIMKKKLEERELKLDETTKYLLQNLNLVSGLEQDKQLYDDLFDVLEKVENISTKDLKMLMKLNRETTKEYQEKLQRELDQTRTALSALPSTSTAEATIFGREAASFQDLPNLFHDGEQFYDLEDDQFLHAVLTSTDTKSLYMVLEAIDYYGDCTLATEVLQKLVEMKKERGWSTVPLEFSNSFPYNASLRSLSIASCPELVSDAGSKMLACTETVKLRELVTKEKMYKFYFRHPATTSCTRPQECGFLIKVTPATEENPEQFNMQLVTDPAMYPADIHLHSDLISADNIHLVAELRYNGRFNNMHISWAGKPHITTNNTHPITWRGYSWGYNEEVRLVVYYDLTGHY